MSKYISDCLLRLDGRKINELRSIDIEIQNNNKADGSCTYIAGLTKVICSVYGPRENKKKAEKSNSNANINVEFLEANFSRTERKAFNKNDRYVKDINIFLTNLFKSIIDTTLYPGSEILLTIMVLQNDNGVLSAAINGLIIAIMDAGIPIIDVVTAVTITSSLVNQIPLIDPCGVERALGETTIVMSNGIIYSVRGSMPKEIENILETVNGASKVVQSVIRDKITQHNSLKVNIDM